MSVSPSARKRSRSKRSITRRSPLKTQVPERRPAATPKTASRIYWEPEELRAFFRTMPDTSFWYQYFFIEYYFGCRLSEPALILESDYHAKKGLITLKRLKKVKEEGGFRAHTYRVDARVRRAIEIAIRWKSELDLTENPFLFPSPRKRASEDVGAERLSQLRNMDGAQAVSRFTTHRMFAARCKEAKIPKQLCHSHVLRHTRATMLLASGSSVEAVQNVLSHSTPKMTASYIVFAEQLKAKFPNVDGLGL